MFSLMDFKSYKDNNHASNHASSTHESQFKVLKLFAVFFTTTTGIKFLSFCSTAQKNLKSYKIRRKGYICTLITCLDLLHINQTVKPHQHTRNYTHRLSVTVLSNFTHFLFYVRILWNLVLGSIFFLFFLKFGVRIKGGRRRKGALTFSFLGEKIINTNNYKKYLN